MQSNNSEALHFNYCGESEEFKKFVDFGNSKFIIFEEVNLEEDLKANLDYSSH